MLQGHGQRSPVTLAELLEPPLESLLVAAEEAHLFADVFFRVVLILRTQKIHRKSGHDSPRPEIGSEHGEDHSFSQRNEQEFRHAGEKNIGIKTMQMQMVETKAGIAICCAPSRMACMVSLPIARFRLMFSISTVASSTRMPTAKASPPSVMMLMVWPSALSAITLTRMESGMEIAIIRVLFQFPRNSRIITAVRQAAISASRITP